MARAIGSGLDAYVHREARERALNTVMEARDEAARLIASAEESARGLLAEAIARSEAAREARLREATAQATLAARREVVRRRQEFLDAFWAEAADRLRQLADAPRETRLEILGNLVEDAAAQLAGSAWEMRIDVTAHDRPLLTAEVVNGLLSRVQAYGVTSLAVAEGDMPAMGGVIARKVGSREIVVNTFDERLALAKRSLRDEVERRLRPSASVAAGPLVATEQR